jgi:hypothetical protein
LSKGEKVRLGIDFFAMEKRNQKNLAVKDLGLRFLKNRVS